MATIGGFSEPREADPTIQALCDSVKREVEEKTGENFNIYKAKTYRSQVVAGTNYLVKVHVGEDCAHLLIYEPLHGRGSELRNLLYPKRPEDPLEPF